MQGQTKLAQTPAVAGAAGPGTAAPPSQGVAPGTPAAPAAAPQSCSSLTSQRRVLQTQNDRLLSERLPIAERLRAGNAATGPDIAGLQSRIKILDDQLLAHTIQIGNIDVAIAQQSAVSGSCEPSSGRRQDDVVPVMAGLLTFVLLMPVVIAISRRIWRRAGNVATTISGELNARLTRLEQAVESVAIEVERVGEGQRFMTNMFMDTTEKALGAGAMEPIEIRAPDRVGQTPN